MLSALLSEALAPLRAQPVRAAVLLDIDGTLAPIVDHAADARVPEDTRRALIPLTRRYGLVACISGRRASEARAMVSVGTIAYLGSHGAELLQAGWTTAVLDPEVEKWGGRVRGFAQGADSPELRRLRVRREDKGAIAAFHWRAAPDEAAARNAVEAIAGQALEAGFHTHWGRKVLEVRPPVQINKGAGLTKLLAEHAQIDMAMYAGDDMTDLDAFAALRELVSDGRLRHAVTVGVASPDGPGEIVEQADVVVEGPLGVRELLAMLDETS